MRRRGLAGGGTGRRLWIAFAAVLAAAVAAEAWVVHEAHFDVESVFGFNAWFALLAGAGVIGIARLLGGLLARPDTYYEDRDD